MRHGCCGQVKRAHLLTGLRFCGGHTVANIPYDALAMELTTNARARSQILGIKGLFGLAGYLLATVTSLFMGIVIGTSIVEQVTLPSGCRLLLLVSVMGYPSLERRGSSTWPPRTDALV